MLAGEPDAARFDETIGTLVRAAAGRNGAKGVHVYGDMVGLLWKAKQYAAAARLENLWNELRATIDFDLFCAYPIDVLTEPFDANTVEALLQAHTHLMPTDHNRGLEAALHRAYEELVGNHGGTLAHRASEIREPNWASLPDAEAMIIWLRRAMPDDATAVLALAERYYRRAS
jgi:hypothetical protein